MWQVRQSFEERVQEIVKYLKVLERLEETSVVLFDKSTNREKRVFEAGSFKVMKSSVFILLYNLVESSVRSAFGDLYQTVESSGKSAAEVKSEFRKIWIKQRYKSLDPYSASSQTFRELTEALIEATVSGNPLQLTGDKLPVSGNLDSKAIFKVCKLHGITVKVHKQAFGGAELIVVKNNRNQLAHGNITFSDCGQQYTVSDLQRISRQTVVFVRGVLNSVEKFIRQSGYLST